MFEQKFLAYLLFQTLVEFRAQGIETDDKPLYWISHLLHNVPYSLLNENASKESYRHLEANIRTFKFDKWLENHKTGFFMSFPEYLPEHTEEKDSKKDL